MKNFNLTDYEKIETNLFSFLARADNIYFASMITDPKQIEFLKQQGITLAIDLKHPDETNFDEPAEFKKLGINYTNYPVQGVDHINFEMLSQINQDIDQTPGKKLIYCASSNRVGALMSLLLSKICGHPKERAFEFGKKAGMSRDATMQQVQQQLNL